MPGLGGSDAGDGGQLRLTRLLIALCIAVLTVTSVGLVWTARDVANWIDERTGAIELARVQAAIAHLERERPGLDKVELAKRVAAGFLLSDARITSDQPVPGVELAAELEGSGGRMLVWSAPAFGHEARGAFSPTRMPLILGSVLVVAVLLLRLDRLARIVDGDARLARKAANTDALTGLGNRLAFDTDLAARMTGSERFALACIDLNGFKAVNDHHGHAAGDSVLRGVAARLRRLAGERDAAYRLGGDEFAMLLADDGRNLGRVARKIVLNIDDAYPLDGGATVHVGVCVGLAIAPQDAASARDLLQQADAAMYRAKALAGSRCCFAADAAAKESGGEAAAA